ncbi:hypothetical protein ADL15_40685 [Actinoplanes awajinensis subsp. mycoplanecinus]|uniref:Uncharacterized protein n=1 Tax=Actinoplanes awajinensis subsp. mycoplanecinus TaxID=135947 RepID=A0A101JEK2_9ACTN|nr:hypothetical protein ADL15_40685 [Actinoplanes awajinensis subsp. mycoplanecinus]
MNYADRMTERGRTLPSGTAFANKGEPSAADTAYLRRALDDEQKSRLQGIVARSLRSGFMDAATATDADT